MQAASAQTLVDETAPVTALKFDAGSFSTNIVHQGVLRYSYQRQNFFFHTSVETNWYSHLVIPNKLQFGFRNSVYWKTGPWELTLGANYYHRHINSEAVTPSENENFVTLKLAPVLNLSNGFRLSSTLLYSSRRPMEEQHGVTSLPNSTIWQATSQVTPWNSSIFIRTVL